MRDFSSLISAAEKAISAAKTQNSTGVADATGAADVSSAADATGAADVSSAADATGAADVSSAADATSVTDAADVSSATDLSAGPVVGGTLLKRTQINLKRDQIGFFHVWIRGSNRNNVFYNNADFIGFLERCHKSAIKNETIVSAFVLMDNHVHLQIYTRALNAFMKSLLMSFNQWYNWRKGLSGQLFNSPFSSKLIDNEDYLLYNYLYILTNPVRAGICKNITKYKWSSYHFTKKEKFNFLNKYINVSDLVFNNFFKSNIELHYTANKHLREYWSLLDDKKTIETNTKAIADYKRANDDKKTLEREKESIKGLETIESDNKTRANNNNNNNNREKRSYLSRQTNHLVRPTDHEVATSLSFLLKERKLNELSHKELIRVMKILRDHGNATYRQISSVTHESLYEVIRDLATVFCIYLIY